MIYDEVSDFRSRAAPLFFFFFFFLFPWVMEPATSVWSLSSQLRVL